MAVKDIILNRNWQTIIKIINKKVMMGKYKAKHCIESPLTYE